MSKPRLVAVLAVIVVLGPMVAPPGSAAPPYFAETTTGVQVSGTYTPVVGNFGGPSIFQSIIWFGPGAAPEQLWLSNGSGGFVKSSLSRQVNGTYQILVGNFSGDTRDDIFLYTPGPGPDFLWETQGNFASAPTFAQVSKSVGGTFRPFVLHDFRNGGGFDDIFWYAPGPASDSVWSFKGGGRHDSHAAPVAGSPTPVVGDFDADTFEDVLFYVPGATPDPLWRGNGNGVFTVVPRSISGTYMPVVGDFGGTAVIDILWVAQGPAPDPVWHGVAGGGGAFTTSSRSLSGRGTPVQVLSIQPDLLMWDTAGPDRVWRTNQGATPDQLSGNTEIPAGYTPITGIFSDANTILWYKPGSAPERMFTKAFTP